MAPPPSVHAAHLLVDHVTRGHPEVVALVPVLPLSRTNPAGQCPTLGLQSAAADVLLQELPGP
eukprot:4109065-Pyramimonas_sp.AAC.1